MKISRLKKNALHSFECGRKLRLKDKSKEEIIHWRRVTFFVVVFWPVLRIYTKYSDAWIPESSQKCARPAAPVRRFSFGLISGLGRLCFDFLVGRNGVGSQTWIRPFRPSTLAAVAGADVDVDVPWTSLPAGAAVVPFAAAEESKLRRRAAAERPQVRKLAHGVVFTPSKVLFSWEEVKIYHISPAGVK